jgi:hypothetical protein
MVRSTNTACAPQQADSKPSRLSGLGGQNWLAAAGVGVAHARRRRAMKSAGLNPSTPFSIGKLAHT